MALKQGQKSDTSNIQSYIRVRPLSENEKRSTSLIIGRREVEIKSTSDVQKSSKTFPFDRVFGEDSKQVIVYTTIIQPMIQEVIQGYNCTVFAYGQTGTGKTYTMSGTQDHAISWDANTHAGIIPRALEDVFTQLSGQPYEYKVSISFIELYNEKLRSLLNDSVEDIDIRLIDDSEGGVILKGLSPTPVQSRDQAFQLLQKGAEKRHVAATLMNVNSSRSHTIFTIYINVKESILDKGDVLRLGKFHLVDLAGSENVSKSGASEKVNKSVKGVNKRLAEASNINKSLLTLGRVITSITENNPHIPYRESKLTRLLRDSLGGKTKTCVIGTISPSHANMEETENTLNYASKARCIKNKPEKNQTVTQKEFMQIASEEILKLKRDIEAIRLGDGFYITKETHEEMTARMKQLDSQVENWYERYNTLNASFETHKENYSLLRDDYEDKCAEYDELVKFFQVESNKLKVEIEEVKKEVIVREFFIKEYQKTEKNLSEQAKHYNSVLENLMKQSGALHDKISRKAQNVNTNVEGLEMFKNDVATKVADINTCLNNVYKEEQKFINDIYCTSGNVLDKLCDQKSALNKCVADYNVIAKRSLTDLLDCKHAMISELDQLDCQDTDMRNGVFNQISNTKKHSILFEEEAERLQNEGNEILKDIANVTELLTSIMQFCTPPRNIAQAHFMYKEIASHTLDKIHEVNMNLESSADLVTKSTEENAKAIKKAQEVLEAFGDLQFAICKSFADTAACQNEIYCVREKCGSIPENLQRIMGFKDTLNCSIEDRLSKLRINLAFEEKENKKLETKLSDTKTEMNRFCRTTGNRFMSVCTSAEFQHNSHLEKKKHSLHTITSLGQRLDTEAAIVSRDRDEFCAHLDDLLTRTIRSIDAETRKQSDHVTHSRNLDQFKKLASNKLQHLQENVQKLKYLLDHHEGTTTEQLKMSDLDWPTHSDSSPTPEVLMEHFIQEQEARVRTPSECSTSSSVSLVSTRTLPPNKVGETPKNLKRSTSMPSVVEKTPEEDKENFCRPNIPKTCGTRNKSAKSHIQKSGLKKPQSYVHNKK